MIKVTITDDHVAFRSATAKLLTAAGLTIIAATSSSKNLIHAIQSGNVPHIAIINYKTSNPETLWVAVWIKEHYPAIKIILTSLYPVYIPIQQLQEIGIEGLVIKSAIEPGQLVSIIHTVYNGGIMYP
jgi:DNA-binding NarL/FixJ family response regulator